MFSKRHIRRIAIGGVAALVVAFIAVQLVPYGRDHTNPPVMSEPQWDSARTRKLAAQACFDCHSNETHWPWYSNIAPFSWLTQNDVDEGRDELNFSEWDQEQDSDDIVEEFRDGEMPPTAYKLRFWDRLSGSERDELLTGLIQTFGDERAERD